MPIEFKKNARVGLLAKLGRGKYNPQLAAQVAPAEPRIERALYLRWVNAVYTLWAHKVADKLNLNRHDAADRPDKWRLVFVKPDGSSSGPGYGQVGGLFASEAVAEARRATYEALRNSKPESETLPGRYVVERVPGTPAAQPKIPKAFTQGRNPGNALLDIEWDQLVDQSGLSDVLDRAAKSLQDRNRAYFEKVLRTNPPEVGSRAQSIAAFRKQNIELVKNAGHDMIADLNNVLSVENSKGTRHEEIARIVQDRIGVSKSRAKNIARDQTLKYNASVQQTQAQAAGLNEYTWSTSRDGAVRHMHKALEGKRFNYNDPPVTNEEGDRNNPGEDFNCRCSAIPFIKLFEGIDDEEEAAPQGASARRAVASPAGPVVLDTPAPVFAPVVAPVPVAAKPSPLVTRAPEVAKLFDRVVETPISGNSQKELRDVLRDQVAHSFPEATSKDIQRKKVGRSTLIVSDIDAAALHSWTGDTILAPDTADAAKRLPDMLAKDAFKGFHIPQQSGSQLMLDEATADKVNALSGMNTVVHEELHGHSRTSKVSYRSEVGRVLEEVGTELSARQITFAMSPDIAASAEALQGKEVFKLVNGQYETIDMVGFVTYQSEIADLTRMVSDAAEKHDGLNLARPAAQRLIVDAHAKGVLSEGPSFKNAHEHLDAFVRSLNLSPAAREEVRGNLLREYPDL
jgi:SPP1 gp7 family putative phage head morphogenesis protein